MLDRHGRAKLSLRERSQDRASDTVGERYPFGAIYGSVGLSHHQFLG
jgi:hypothetical protein